jgi:hypothetical protein
MKDDAIDWLTHNLQIIDYIAQQLPELTADKTQTAADWIRQHVSVSLDVIDAETGAGLRT